MRPESLAKKKNPNSLGIHRRKRLLRICHALGIREAPMWSNRDIIYALADARRIEIGRAHKENAEIVIAWFELNEPLTLAPKPKTPKPAKSHRSDPKREFYQSWEWRTLRMEVLKKHGPVCMCCGATRGDTTMAGDPVKICVDHVQPLATHWELRLDPSNLQVLCDECNQGKGAWDQTDWRVVA